jgi:uncharacterized protein
MSAFQGEFYGRMAGIPRHGIGLSVDVYSPDLLELSLALDKAGALPDYLEIFKAPLSELVRIRAALPETALAYHAEGLWVTEPDMRTRYPWKQACEQIARHTEALDASWVNHECAAKQFGGFSVGTYLPPLFTDAAAEATAANTIIAQKELDLWYAEQGKPRHPPLLLLELPPLTYFGFGTLTVAEFFRRIIEKCACGLVLDIGHLWTHWRYRERFRFPSLEAFTTDFLQHFPVERVVQIHLAGLGVTEEIASQWGALPWWVDAHAARVPPLLWDLLRQVLSHPGLTSLKGIALEVDTKTIPLIVEEFGRLRDNPACRTALLPSVERSHPLGTRPIPDGDVSGLAGLYRTYARVVSGEQALEEGNLVLLAESLDGEGLLRYRTQYLPHELVRWGGDLEELFPAIWAALRERRISGHDFVRFWFRRPSESSDPYDFFYIKLERWVSFISEVAPDLAGEVAREAGILRTLHAELNDEPTGTPLR